MAKTLSQEHLIGFLWKFEGGGGWWHCLFTIYSHVQISLLQQYPIAQNLNYIKTGILLCLMLH